MQHNEPGAGRTRPFLNTRQAGHYLGLTPRHLERLRSQGRGPVFRRHCRFVVYHIDDLDAWSRAHSSSEANNAG
jgi:transposase